ncbi:hypothetical protein PZA11_002059 [Diplocarpon coronariae]|uniref:Hydantoinase/oxoprolinase n=1 Tax=Diplocarpon coronariae TaxID=2795749 RepID=A0A218Z825_9HELO|nr:hypothetical protein JHW43_004736 [Diplocarpon mali]OWP03405.1 hydantoinase/oxoprolinase [Marssonina coronariae]
MPSKLVSCTIGIDVGGTNTDSVILQNDQVLAWHKTPTTPDIQEGVERAIAAVVKEAKISSSNIGSVKIGTTQFVNAVLEQDSSKLDKVAIVRLCGPYSRGSPPFANFPSRLRGLMEGHSGFVDGGYQVDGAPILPLNSGQLKEQAAIIRSKSLTSVVVIGIYSPSNPSQEEEARQILAQALGPGYDISCSHAIGRTGFLERENASILNASLRRFARHVIDGFRFAVQRLGRCNLYITLNDGTLSKASTAAEYPVRCFSSGPTNSARGAALLANLEIADDSDDREVLVVDVGGTTTDICALLQTGYPRQSAAFVKIAGLRTNFTIPDVKSIALGGGSLVRINGAQTSVGPDSVGSKLDMQAIFVGGGTLTTTDLVLENDITQCQVSSELRVSALLEISRALEEAIDIVKTKQGDAKVILVGGGSIIIPGTIAGVGEVIRPKYLEVANAVGAAIGKISGAVDSTVVPVSGFIDKDIQEAKTLAIERCIAAGGNIKTIEIVEVDVIPVSYVTNGATRLLVRVVGDLVDGYEESHDDTGSMARREVSQKIGGSCLLTGISDETSSISKGSSYEVQEYVDLNSYRPRIEGDFWYLSEMDLQFLQDGTGVLAVGSCGEPYPAYIACLLALQNGEDITIRRQDTLPDDAVVLVAGFMGSPSVYLERIPGLDEVTDAMKGVMKATGITKFDAVIPNEIGGMNAFEALLAAHRFNKSALDSDLVARAYPKVWQTVRCLADIPVAPAAVADGIRNVQIFQQLHDNLEVEDLMREACTGLGSLCGMCVNPVHGIEARTLPQNSFSHAWMIGRAIALSRSLKQDPVTSLIESEHGVLLFTGKIISVTRHVAEGFTRGSVLLESFCESPSPDLVTSLLVDFENENLSATLRTPGQNDRVLAVCPDLITFLDKANGAPLGISDYKYGLRVSVIALGAPPMWTTERGLEVGGPKAFGLEIDYKGVSVGTYEPPRSVWELFGEGK